MLKNAVESVIDCISSSNELSDMQRIHGLAYIVGENGVYQ